MSLHLAAQSSYRTVALSTQLDGVTRFERQMSLLADGELNKDSPPVGAVGFGWCSVRSSVRSSAAPLGRTGLWLVGWLVGGDLPYL